MKTLIVYYSLEGNTAYAADKIASLTGAEKAFGKLKAALGIDSLEAELILIDPKEKPNQANEKKIEAFCAKMK